MPTPTIEYATPAQASITFGISRTRIFSLLRAGVLTRHKLSSRVTLIDVAELRAYLASTQQPR